MRRLPFTLVLTAALILIAACATGSSAISRPPRRHDVAIQDFVFRPESLVVSVGDTVRWMNADAFAHTATAHGNRFDSGSLSRSAHAVFVPVDTGSYPYRCTFHPTMEGIVIAR